MFTNPEKHFRYQQALERHQQAAAEAETRAANAEAALAHAQQQLRLAEERRLESVEASECAQAERDRAEQRLQMQLQHHKQTEVTAQQEQEQLLHKLRNTEHELAGLAQQVHELEGERALSAAVEAELQVHTTNVTPSWQQVPARET